MRILTDNAYNLYDDFHNAQCTNTKLPKAMVLSGVQPPLLRIGSLILTPLVGEAPAIAPAPPRQALIGDTHPLMRCLCRYPTNLQHANFPGGDLIDRYLKCTTGV